MSATVHVTNIAAQTDDKEIKEFFSFCGKITDINVTTTTPTTKSATVTFEKPTAAKTALLLDHTRLGPSEITVSLPPSDGDSPSSAPASPGPHNQNHSDSDDHITQEEKPRARILAEYLAHGYLVADTGLKTAIDLDHKHGVSQRFVSTLQRLDTKYHATDRARATDQSYGITTRANTLLSGLGSYFEKATNTPTGKKLADFYTTSSKQVGDIYTEAMRLAELKKEEAGGSSYKAAGLDKVFGPERKTADKVGGDDDEGKKQKQQDGGAAGAGGSPEKPAAS